MHVHVCMCGCVCVCVCGWVRVAYDTQPAAWLEHLSQSKVVKQDNYELILNIKITLLNMFHQINY